MKSHRILPWMAAALLSTGCKQLGGPAYERPDTPEPVAWSGAAPQPGERTALRLDWWRAFGDTELDRFVEQALDGNFDLRVAAGRIARAEALAGVAASRALPTLGASVGATFGIQDLGLGSASGVNGFTLGGGINWELDLWGKLRKGEAAAEADARASGADWRMAHLVVASQVANQYFRLRQLDALAQLYERFITSSERILNLYEARAAEELVSRDVVLRQRAERLRLERERQDLQRERATVENSLAVLVGLSAGTLKIPASDRPDRLHALDVPPGLASDLLERRPDILAAEYRVIAAYNLEAQARLARLPTIALTGQGGASSSSLSSLLQQWLFTGGPTIEIPLFDPVRKRQVEVRAAEARVAADQYRGTVVRAFQEVDNALINLASWRQQAENAQRALADLSRAQTIQIAQFEEGLLSQLQVLESERSLLQAEQVTLDLRFRLLNENVTLYKAVGGGWPLETPGENIR